MDVLSNEAAHALLNLEAHENGYMEVFPFPEQQFTDIYSSGQEMGNPGPDHHQDEIIAKTPPLICMADDFGRELSDVESNNYMKLRVDEGIPYSYIPSAAVDDTMTLLTGADGEMSEAVQHAYVNSFSHLETPIDFLYDYCGEECYMLPEQQTDHVRSNQMVDQSMTLKPTHTPEHSYETNDWDRREITQDTSEQAAKTNSFAPIIPNKETNGKFKNFRFQFQNLNAKHVKIVEDMIMEFQRNSQNKKKKILTKKGKIRITKEERILLENLFAIISKPSNDLYAFIAEQLQMDVLQVRSWFCRRRVKQGIIRNVQDRNTGTPEPEDNVKMRTWEGRVMSTYINRNYIL